MRRRKIKYNIYEQFCKIKVWECSDPIDIAMTQYQNCIAMDDVEKFSKDV